MERWWLSEGDGRRNEGTGLEGREEGSFERQDWKEGMTLDIRSLNRFAIGEWRLA